MSGPIQLAGLRVERDGLTVVHNVDLVIATGQWFGLIGANGSGKTTLLRAVAGRLPIAAGACRIGEADLSSDRTGRAERIAFAPPAEALPESLRARDLLALVASNTETALHRLCGLRAALGIDALLDQWIGGCSAGMRQRIAMACAFATGLPIVILDEPFNWLDPVVAFDVKRALRETVDRGRTLITALHDLPTLTHECDAGAMMADGAIALRLDQATLEAGKANLPAFEQRMIGALRAQR